MKFIISVISILLFLTVGLLGSLGIPILYYHYVPVDHFVSISNVSFDNIILENGVYYGVFTVTREPTDTYHADIIRNINRLVSNGTVEIYGYEEIPVLFENNTNYGVFTIPFNVKNPIVNETYIMDAIVQLELPYDIKRNINVKSNEYTFVGE